MAMINYDNRTIQVIDEWYTKAGLKDKIADMLASGNFKITMFGKALEDLDREMEGAEDITVVLPAQTLNGLNKLVTKSSRSTGDYIREALKIYLRSRKF